VRPENTRDKRDRPRKVRPENTRDKQGRSRKVHPENTRDKRDRPRKVHPENTRDKRDRPRKVHPENPRDKRGRPRKYPGVVRFLVGPEAGEVERVLDLQALEARLDLPADVGGVVIDWIPRLRPGRQCTRHRYGRAEQ
jgi:hypothetical protein